MTVCLHDCSQLSPGLAVRSRAPTVPRGTAFVLPPRFYFLKGPLVHPYCMGSGSISGEVNLDVWGPLTKAFRAAKCSLSVKGAGYFAIWGGGVEGAAGSAGTALSQIWAAHDPSNRTLLWF